MSSISAIMREAAGCEMLSTCAAALTWPLSSSATIMRMWRELSPLRSRPSLSSPSALRIVELDA